MISTVTWIAWAIIGICGGYMTSRLLLDGRFLTVMGLAGVAGALLGGWALMTLVQLTPDNAERWQYISMLTSLAGAAIVLWPAYVLIRSRRIDDDDENDFDDE